MDNVFEETQDQLEPPAEAETGDWAPDNEYEHEAAAESAASLGITDADEQSDAGWRGQPPHL